WQLAHRAWVGNGREMYSRGPRPQGFVHRSIAGLVPHSPYVHGSRSLPLDTDPELRKSCAINSYTRSLTVSGFPSWPHAPGTEPDGPKKPLPGLYMP